MKKKLLASLVSVLILANTVLAIDEILSTWQTIFVSSQSGSDTNPGTMALPLQTLAKAKDIATNSSSTGFAILLKGGENYTPATPMTSQALLDYCDYRYHSAFIWDLNKPLLLSTYGNDLMAELGPGTATSTTSTTVMDQNALQTAISVCYPCAESVTIENIFIRHWELGGIFPYKYLPGSSSKKLTIRNCVFDEIGTIYFPEETFLQPGYDYTIYAADVIQPRTSNNIYINDNIFKNCNNYFDAEHSTPFLMDSFHVFYIAKSHDIHIWNNIIINSGGPPVKAKYATAYNVSVSNNAFFYTSPSAQIETVQEGFVRCGADAVIEVKENHFYCPFVWPDYEDPATAVAVTSSGDAVDNIIWIDNSFEMPYYDPPTGPCFTNMDTFGYNLTDFSRRYYDGNAFVYLTADNWQPSATALAPYSTNSILDVPGLLDYKYQAYFLGDENFEDSNSGWNLDYLLPASASGLITAYGSSIDGQYAGWLVLAPKTNDPLSTGDIIFEDRFDERTISGDWNQVYENTDTGRVGFSVNLGSDSRLSVIRMVPLADEKWTSMFLKRNFMSQSNFHIDFDQDWQQDDIADMPYMQLFLYSDASLVATVGYEDNSPTEFGHTRVYTVADSTEILGSSSSTGSSSWDIRGVNDIIEIRLNDQLITSVADTRAINEIWIAVQGRYMFDPSLQWLWNGYPNLGVDLVRVANIPSQNSIGDSEPDGDVDLIDFAHLASHWLNIDCSATNWCQRSDLNYSNKVDMEDLVIFAENWATTP